VHTGEIDEGGGGEDGVALARDGRHEVDDDACGGYGCNSGEWKQDVAVTPVEEMAVAEEVEILRAQGGAGIEKAVCDVDGPDGECEQDGNPSGQKDVRYPGKG
jgi:hypothetical protein